MKRATPWLVTPVNTRAPRPGSPGGAGDPSRCFYCPSATGTEHAEDCVVRKRTVVLRMTIEYVVDVPEDRTPEQIEWHRNMSSWCKDNDLDLLSEDRDSLEDSGRCYSCGIATIEYVREATERDHDDVPEPRRAELLADERAYDKDDPVPDRASAEEPGPVEIGDGLVVTDPEVLRGRVDAPGRPVHGCVLDIVVPTGTRLNDDGTLPMRDPSGNVIGKVVFERPKS